MTPPKVVGRPDLLTIDQAIEFLGCSRSWFFRNVRTKVPAFILSQLMFSEADLRAFVEAQREHVKAGTGNRTRKASSDPRPDWENASKKHGLAFPMGPRGRVGGDRAGGRPPDHPGSPED